MFCSSSLMDSASARAAAQSARWVAGRRAVGDFQDEQARIPFDGVLVETDSRLGVEGRPQSASGQTTILTGINAPAAIGHHKQGFPNAALLKIIREHSIFLQLDARESLRSLSQTPIPNVSSRVVRDGSQRPRRPSKPPA